MLFRAPRFLGILLVVFLALLATDTFQEGRAPLQSMQAFLIHLIPAVIIVAALVVAWRWELAGRILFLALAAAYVWLTGGSQWSSAYIILAGILGLVGVLFLVDWLHRTWQKHA